MTTYFDTMHERVAAIPDEPSWEQVRALGLIEVELVRDCAVCAEFAGFPSDLRDAIDRTILSKGLLSRPEVKGFPQFDCEDYAAHKSALNVLVQDLHTIFHAVAMRGLSDFSDSPLSGVQQYDCRAEERRDNDAAAFVLFTELLPFLLEK